MPTPDRTSLTEIVAAGGVILERDGLAGVTMAAVAERVGVRAPSLYKRVRSRDELLALVGAAEVDELRSRLDVVAEHADPRARLDALASALRAYAHDRPAGFRLIFTPGDVTIDRDRLEAASAPLFDAVTALTGRSDALEAARTMTSWATGFITMELGGAFRLGGDVDAAFAYGVRILTDAIAAGEGARS